MPFTIINQSPDEPQSDLERLKREVRQRKQAEELLRTIAAGTATLTGGDLFRPLVQHLAVAFKSRCAIITECTDVTHTRVRTLAYIEAGKFEEDFEFDLIGRPCELVVSGRVIYYPQDLAKVFPLEEGYESYIGVPVYDLAGQRILGHLAVLDDKPMERQEYEASIMQIFAGRAGAELERQQVLAKLQQANDELEIRVEQRTAELQVANQKLQQEIQERQALIAELDAFAHTVAHDLKNPLSIVTAYVQMLQEEWLSDEERLKATTTITKHSHKMETIIDELLLLSYVRHEDTSMAPLDMADIVNNALQRLTLSIDEHNASITVPDEWPVAVGHAPWVEEVWENYLSNAIKYGGTPPHIALGATPQDDGMIRFWVQDQGPGLTEAQQTNLFAPFTQVHRTGRKSQGLGLSIVQRIIDKLGGQVGVTSAPGQGSLFWFALSAKR